MGARVRGLGRLAAGAAVGLLLIAPPAWAGPRPANLRPDPNTDEGGLWQKVDKAELDARDSAELNPDPALNQQIKRVACKLAPEYCGEIRIYVMDRPFVNASMAPNGYMEVWSGLLLRAQSEDQLAFVLGHEISHFAENHSLASWRNMKSRGNAAMMLQMAVGAVAIGVAASSAPAGGAGGSQQTNDIMRAAGSINDLIYLGAVAGMFSYDRQEEFQADQLGLTRAAAAGYDPAAASEFWRRDMAETAASDFPKVRGQATRASVFATHPITAERVKALDDLAAAAPKGQAQDRKAYRAMIRPFLGVWLKDDLRRRDYGQTLYLLDRLGADGEDLGLLGFYRGECLRLRRGPTDLDQARAAYLAAAAYPDVPVALWRNLGDLQAQAGDKAAARTAYQTYLARATGANDRWLVEATLKKLDGDSGT